MGAQGKYPDTFHAIAIVYYCNGSALSWHWRTGVNHFPTRRESEICRSRGGGNQRKRAADLRQGAGGGETGKYGPRDQGLYSTFEEAPQGRPGSRRHL